MMKSREISRKIGKTFTISIIRGRMIAINNYKFMKKSLAKLQKVDLRDVWGHEALDFTKWLAGQENLDILSEEIGIDIKHLETEAEVGRFNVDILAEEEASGRKIIIENQLEDTNHDHLGKIITYASGYDAEIIIWLVRDFREEHQKAVDWLNEHTDENINFFLIKIELWQIEGSNPAPKFEIISKPNEWAKVIKSNSTKNGLTDTKLQQLDFWTKFKSFVQDQDKHLRLQTPRPQHWYDVSLGSSDAHVALTVNTREDLIGCEIYISRSKGLFNFLMEQKEQIENEIGEKAEWVNAPVASRIKISKKVSGIFDQNEGENYYRWLYEKIFLFQKVFGKHIREFKNF